MRENLNFPVDIHKRAPYMLGSGYPDRLSGELIPLGASVIAVCAAFVAMMRHRPFSDAITVEEALDELRRCSGSQFDPGVVDAFCELLRLAMA